MLQTIDNSQVGYGAGATYNKTITGAQLSLSGRSDENGTFFAERVNLSYFRVEESATYNHLGAFDTAESSTFDLLRSFVVELFRQQGLEVTLSTGEQEIAINALSQQEAQTLIAEDGYFGVEQTSDRIVDFAIGLAGGDPSRLDAVLAGVQRGFDEALEAFGGWLPDISYQTYDAVQQKLDAWANGSQAA